MINILIAYLVVLGVLSWLIYIGLRASKDSRPQPTKVSPEVYNWMHIKKSYWVCEECECEIGDRRGPCIDCGFETAKYRVKSKRSKSA
jgi:hypothetical protein